MPLRVLIAPDKFKGTITAQTASELIARGWSEARPDDILELLPMSDGGDGFGEVLARLLNAQARNATTCDPSGMPRDSTWWWEHKSRLAIIESAQTIGLALLPRGEFHPFDLDTFGLGAVFRAATMERPALCLIGIGGSATNDGGFGLARSLGWKFIDDRDQEIDRWMDLRRLRRICKSEQRLAVSEILVAVDVQNPLLGPAGASQTYGPQKGLRKDEIPMAEDCLAQLASVVTAELGLDAACEPGTGAAGGLGYGLRCFLNARLESGFELFARFAKLEERIVRADLVITGEGAIDRSTLMGKGVGEIALLCRRHGVPCVGLAGKLVLDSQQKDDPQHFTMARGIAPQMASEEMSMSQPELWLPRLATATANEFKF
jgi:glycerate 2-kinase